MENISFEKDSDRYLIDFNGVQVSFYFQDGEDVKIRISDIRETIRDFLKCYFKQDVSLENPYFLAYNGVRFTDFNLCLQEDKTIYMQISMENIEYFTNELSLGNLTKIDGFLKDFLSELQKKHDQLI